MPFFPQNSVYKQNMAELKRLFTIKRKLVLPQPKPVYLFRNNAAAGATAPRVGGMPANSSSQLRPNTNPLSSAPPGGAPAPSLLGPSASPAVSGPLDFNPSFVILIIGVLGLSIWSPETEIMSVIVIIGGMVLAVTHAATLVTTTTGPPPASAPAPSMF